MEKLVIGLLGNRNSGKTKTWYELFGEKVKTGKKTKKLELTSTTYVDVFLISQSPEERNIPVEKIIDLSDPKIVLCSIQYIEDVMKTVDYFANNGYFLFIQWLNPGHNDPGEKPYSDYLQIVEKILHMQSIVSVRNSKIDVVNRAQEIREFIYGWSSNRGVLKQL